jgi:crotonobetainyl-CoA:carnitine CoA-transferase CaiB-like acyl-CoA transferase
MPLDDVRVIDLTRYTAGPFCTRMLGDYGADIIKVEQPEAGDPARMLPPFFKDAPGLERSGLFLMLNTNKRSVTIDLKTEGGRGLLLDLVRGAQVLVENFRPGTMERLGIGYDVLHEANPALVVTSISNYGHTGPYRDWEGTDLTLYAMGNMIGFGTAGLEPVKTAGHHPTMHAGYAAALATAVALCAAELRGFGEHVDISIFETLAHSIDMRLGRLLGFQYDGRLGGRPQLASAVGSGTFPCADGYFSMTAGPAFLPRTMQMIGRQDLLEQPEWATLEARSAPERIDEFMAYLLPWMLERTKQEVRAECERFGVLGGPLNTTADLLEDPNFQARGFFQEIDHPTTGPVTSPGYQFRLHREGESMPPRRRAPLLGEHTDEVLAELGLDEGMREALRAKHAI